MQIGEVVGHATATVKHPSLKGWRMLLVQPLLTNGQADGEPILAIDNLGGGRGDRVVLTSDGATVRDMVGENTTPIRWAIIGLADEIKTT